MTLTFSGRWLDFTNRVTVAGCRSLAVMKIRKTGVYDRLGRNELPYVIVDFEAEPEAACGPEPFRITLLRPGLDGRTVFHATLGR